MPSSRIASTIPLDEIVLLLGQSIGAEKAREVVLGAAKLLGTTTGELRREDARRLLDTLGTVPGLVGVTARSVRKQLGLDETHGGASPSSTPPHRARSGIVPQAGGAAERKGRAGNAEPPTSEPRESRRPSTGDYTVPSSAPEPRRNSSPNANERVSDRAGPPAHETRRPITSPGGLVREMREDTEPSSAVPSSGSIRKPRSELVALLAHSLGREKGDELVSSTAKRLGIDAAAFNRDEALRVLADLAVTPGIVGLTARFAKARCVLRFPE